MEVTNITEGEVVENLKFPQNNTSNPRPYPLLKRVYLGSVYIVFGIVTALNVSTVLWNVSMLYIKDPL